jgi:MFS family permease
MNDAPRARIRLTPIQWLIATIASIGVAFDTYEILMLPLVVRPALGELLGVAPGNPEYFRWVRLLFFIPMFCGGVFGLAGGYLTDRFGRRRVLVGSILLYAFSAMGAAYSTSVGMLLVLRCTTLVGVCVEFVAGVAWLAELFPEPKRREAVLGFTQAFASLGGLMVAAINYLAVRQGADWPAILGGHAAWRYTLLSGLIPAIPLILVRPWLPESPTWARKRAEGTLKRPSLAELFTPALARTTLATTLLVAASYGLAFGAIQHMPQIVPGLTDVRGLSPPDRQAAAATAQTFQEIGGLAGRFLLALLVVRIVSRRKLLRLFQVPALVVLPLVFWLAPAEPSRFAQWGIFLCGLVVVGQFSFWGNYLPRVYPTHLRGTGESFAANVGGRVFGTMAVLATTSLAGVMPGADGTASLAHAAAVVALAVAAVGLAASFWLPEPKSEELPE